MQRDRARGSVGYKEKYRVLKVRGVEKQTLLDIEREVPAEIQTELQQLTKMTNGFALRK